MNVHMILSIAVPVPLYKTFDYLLPSLDEDKQDIRVSVPSSFIGKRVVVPFAGRQLVGIVVAACEKVPDEQLEPAPRYKLKNIIKLLDDDACFSDKLRQLILWSSQYYCHPLGECFHTALPVALRKQITSVHAGQMFNVVKWHRTSKPFDKASRAPKQAEILRFFEAQANGMWQDSLKLLGVSVAQLRTLEKKGFLTVEHLDPLSASGVKEGDAEYLSIKLNDEQVSALIDISESLGPFNIQLLHGITGSGKTEVYIARVREMLSQNKQALILIPEINLTPQTLSRFQSQLNVPVGLIHSGMSEKEKLTMWYLAKNGIAHVIIGTRSAIFTPFKNLGLIVVDEEHDPSYKQNDGFKYSARDLAVKRAQIEQCQVILGSATPSLESLLNAKQKKYNYIALTKRAGAGEKPNIQLVDIKSRGMENGCSRPLLHRIQEELEKRNQVIIFQNRRGYSPTLLCNSCGWIAVCPHCDARLTLHSRPPYLHCHHCDYKEPVPRQCKACSYDQLSPLGAGTERLETSFEQLFPETKIIRIDRDSIKKQQDMKVLVEEVNLGEPCILIGTQMLAKGHDFHNVTLVAIIDADTSLFSSDFRSFEHSTQLLLQVSGRTGRGHKRGEVLIQTKFPEHSIFKPIIAGDYDLAANLELQEREECELPPFSKMISIRAESSSQSINFDQLGFIKQSLMNALSGCEGFQLSGPLEASMSRKAGVYRAYLHVFTKDNAVRQSIQLNLPAIVTGLKSKVKIIIDVDPHEYA